MSIKRENAISKLWSVIEVVVGNWMYEDVTSEQDSLKQQIMDVVQNPAVPLSVVEEIAEIVRHAYDLGINQRRR